MQENGVVARENKMIMEIKRCQLHDKELSKKFCAKVENTTVYLLNSS